MKMVNVLLGFGRRIPCYLCCFLLLLVAAGLLITFQPKVLSLMVEKQAPDINLGRTPQQPREDRERLSSQMINPSDSQKDSSSYVSKKSPQIQHNSGAGSFSPESWKKLSLTKETRQQLIKETCAKYKSSIPKTITRAHVIDLFVEDKHKVLYCQVPKAGCSNWKRTLILLAGKAGDAQSIKHAQAHFGNIVRTLNTYDLEEIMHRLKTYTKILFVREPFERMVSAYRDKFKNPDYHYHTAFGRPIISRYRKNATAEALKTGDGVTFKEFAEYLQDDKRPVGIDIHWNLASKICHPCLIDYDFIGKFENMVEESKFALQLAGAPSNITLPTFKDRNVADKKTSLTITEQFFSQVSWAKRQRIYDFYYMDYLMFNYSKPSDDLF